MTPKIDQETCIGCGTCPGICPEVFEMAEDGKAVVKTDADFEANKEKIAEAISSCPVQAITE